MMRMLGGLTVEPEAAVKSCLETLFKGCLVHGIGNVLVDEMTTTLFRL